VEPIAKFTEALRGYKGVRHVLNMGLEDWRGGDDDGATRYDLVWTQWCLGHLTDEQLRRYLERCREALVPGTGVIVVKENLSTSGVDVFDPVDSCVTRYVNCFVMLIPGNGGAGTDHDTDRMRLGRASFSRLGSGLSRRNLNAGCQRRARHGCCR
jgi:hypothetical protein